MQMFKGVRYCPENTGYEPGIVPGTKDVSLILSHIRKL